MGLQEQEPELRGLIISLGMPTFLYNPDFIRRLFLEEKSNQPKESSTKVR